VNLIEYDNILVFCKDSMFCFEFKTRKIRGLDLWVSISERTEKPTQHLKKIKNKDQECARKWRNNSVYV